MCDTTVRLHTRSVCYLTLSRGALTVILAKHKSMMTVIRECVYTAVCTCHTLVTRDIGTYKYAIMITKPTPSSKTTSW